MQFGQILMLGVPVVIQSSVMSLWVHLSYWPEWVYEILGSF